MMEHVKSLLEAFRELQARVSGLKAAHRAAAAELSALAEGDKEGREAIEAREHARESERAEARKALESKRDEAKKAINAATSMAASMSEVDTLAFYANEFGLSLKRLKAKMRRLQGLEAPSHRRRRRARWARRHRK